MCEITTIAYRLQGLVQEFGNFTSLMTKHGFFYDLFVQVHEQQAPQSAVHKI
jgi:hypothetical protein